MANPFEITVIVVCGAGIALCATPLFRPGAALRELGRQGQIWFEHSDERRLAELPADDAVDDPIPVRPLRARN